jgi:pimeloyl-ACP methyl ester carboxylesterase
MPRPRRGPLVRAVAVDVLGSGEPLVLVHGLATTGDVWRRVAPRLSRSRQVATPDVPGFGASPPAGRGFDLAAVADRLRDGLARAGMPEPYDLVGHSMGAAIAIVLADRHPDAVGRLVLVSPAGLAPVPGAIATFAGAAAELYVPLRRAGTPLADLAWGRRLLMAGGVIDGASLPSAEVRRLVGASRGARRIGPALAAVAAADLRELLADLAAPVGAIVGAGDRVVRPGTLHSLRSARPDAACETIAGAAHISMIERPAAFVAALERVLVAIS